jgi:hypothetical protein
MDPEDALIAETACDFADVLEVYAEEVLPQRVSSSRSHTSASSGASSGSRQVFRDVHAPNNPSPATSAVSDSSILGHFLTKVGPYRSEYKSPATATKYTNHSRSTTPGANLHTAQDVPQTIDGIGSTVQPANLPTRTSSKSTQIGTPVRRNNIGRHTIVLNSTSFRFNNYMFPIGTDPNPNQRMSYELANHFFDDLLKHRDKLDELDVALNTQDPRSEWFGIPGWKLHLGRIRLQCSHPRY